MKETTTALRRKKEKKSVENVFLPYKSVQTRISVPNVDLGEKLLPCGLPL
jgi:hypothetical protein